jgi:hypothetical protein
LLQSTTEIAILQEANKMPKGIGYGKAAKVKKSKLKKKKKKKS